METSEIDKARGEESQQIHLLVEAKKTRRHHTLILYAILFIFILQSVSGYINSRYSLEDSRARNETAKAQLEATKAHTEATKARLEAEKANLEADKEYYESVGKSFDFLYTTLNRVERACTQSDSP